jgi:pimeloyl-ACP methyl ester carboxylesterase
VLLLVHGAGFVYETIAARSDLARYPPPGERIDVGGFKLHLYCTGERAAGDPLVVLEAGAGLGGAGWALVQSEVSAFTRVCSWDRAGYAWSDPGPAPRDSRQIATELHTLLATAGEGAPYVLVGHSYGGHTVRIYASQHPDQVAGMVLVDARAAELGPALAARKGSAARQSMLYAIGARFGFLRLAARAIMSSAGMDALTDYPAALSWGAKHQAAVFAEGRYMEESDAQVRAAGGLDDMPLIVIEHDLPLMGEAEEREWRHQLAAMATLSTRGRKIVADGSGHNIMVDRPDVVIDAIREVVEAAMAGGY